MGEKLKYKICISQENMQNALEMEPAPEMISQILRIYYSAIRKQAVSLKWTFKLSSIPYFLFGYCKLLLHTNNYNSGSIHIK